MDINRTDDALNCLLKRYKSNKRAISVDFRKMVTGLKPDRYTHIMHPYPAKLLMHIPHFFLSNEILSAQGDTVLDPFCGSGTVLLEANLMGRKAYGADASPFARLLSKVKTRKLNSNSLKQSYYLLIARIPDEPSIPMPDVVNIEHWFYPRVRKQLLCIYEAIKQVRKKEFREFFLICFSKCVKKVSLADPRLSVPVKMKKDKYPADHWLELTTKKRLAWLKRVNIQEVFAEIVTENFSRISEYSKACNGVPETIIAHDARDMSYGDDLKRRFRKSSANLVITSPPYAGAQKYIRSVSLNLGWLEVCKSNELKDYKSLSIGREEYPARTYKEFTKTDIPSADKILRTIYKEYPLRSHIAANYLLEMRDAFTEASRVLKPGGHFVLVVGDNQICKYDFRTSKYLCNILQDLGFKLKLRLIDDIRSRGLMTKRNKTAGMIAREWVMLFEKD